MDKTYSYNLTYSIDVDSGFDSSYSKADSYNFSDETHDCVYQCLSDISKELNKALQEVCGSDYVDSDLQDYNLYPKPEAYVYLEFNTPKTNEELKDIMLKVEPALEAYSSEQVEFEGDFIGYERGWNLPDPGGPPQYTEETGEAYAYVYLMDILKIEAGEDNDA